jgi:hypothetical protein
MAGDRAVGDFGRAVADHHHRVDEPVLALFRTTPGPAAGSPGAQGVLNFALQTAAGLETKRLVDRLVAHPHALVVGMVQHEPAGDLFRGQLAFQPLLDLRP